MTDTITTAASGSAAWPGTSARRSPVSTRAARPVTTRSRRCARRCSTTRWSSCVIRTWIRPAGGVCGTPRPAHARSPDARVAAGQPLLEEIDSHKGGRANHWHTDVTFVDRPPAFTLLHAVVIPPAGGDTIWANTVTAYQSLPAELRELADRLRIVHTNDHDYAAVYGRGERVDAALANAQEQFVSTVYEAEHPAVRVHPETGERSLVLGGFARTVLGYSPQASRDLIRILQDTSPGRNTGPLEVARGRPGHLGQPGHSALRDLRLRNSTSPRRARHRGRPGSGRRRWQAQRPAQGRRVRVLLRRELALPP